MNYHLATSMRGPDHKEAEGVIYWKNFVTAPLRWMAAIEVNCEPDDWSPGIIISPEEVLEALNAMNFEVEEARKFARSDESYHVKAHAEIAFDYLIGTAQGDIAKRLRDALVAKGLL